MIFLILIVALILRVWNLHQSFWLDEAAQIFISSQDLQTMFNSLQGDFHAPLYYILVHYFTLNLNLEWQMRLLPVTFGVLNVAIIYILAGKLFNHKIALFTAALLAVNPFHIYFSQELRPYILSCLLASASVLLLWLAIKRNGIWWLFLGIITLLSIYTSYFGFFVIIAQFIYILTTKNKINILNCFLTFTGAIILFLPWVPTLLNQLKVSSSYLELPGWSEAVSVPYLKALPLTWVKFIIGQINFYPFWLYLVISGVVSSFWGLLFIIGVSVKEKKQEIFYILLIAGLSLFIPLVVSITFPIISPKRVIYVLPFIIMMVSLGISKFSKQSEYFILALSIISSLFFVSVYQMNSYFQREDWRGAVNYIESNSAQQTAVLFKFNSPFVPYIWYAQNNIPTIALAPQSVVQQEFLDKNLNQLLQGKNQVFLFQYIEGLTDKEKLADKKLEEIGFKKTSTVDFPGVGFVYQYRR